MLLLKVCMTLAMPKMCFLIFLLSVAYRRISTIKESTWMKCIAFHVSEVLICNSWIARLKRRDAEVFQSVSEFQTQLNLSTVKSTK